MVSLLIERLPLWLPARFDSPVWAVSLGYEDQAVWEPLVQTETVAEYSRRCAAYPPTQPVFNLAFAATLDGGFHDPPLDDEAALIEIADSLEEDAERARDMWIEIAQHFNAHADRFRFERADHFVVYAANAHGDSLLEDDFRASVPSILSEYYERLGWLG